MLFDHFPNKKPCMWLKLPKKKRRCDTLLWVLPNTFQSQQFQNDKYKNKFNCTLIKISTTSYIHDKKNSPKQTNKFHNLSMYITCYNSPTQTLPLFINKNIYIFHYIINTYRRGFICQLRDPYKLCEPI